ncbi:hypothetical protein RSAG8_09888, partial [Rhizoctonia solani AG-8 WAC10335]
MPRFGFCRPLLRVLTTISDWLQNVRLGTSVLACQQWYISPFTVVDQEDFLSMLIVIQIIGHTDPIL